MIINKYKQKLRSVVLQIPNFCQKTSRFAHSNDYVFIVHTTNVVLGKQDFNDQYK